METMALWEQVLLGLLVVVILVWFFPGLKRTLKSAPKATASDWKSLLIPIGLVVLFVLLLLSFV
ncbi:MAG TPA: hypothetical protein ENK38_00390 [Gammaproteobacteria bacterium]|nr:hypothetical protein [Gammaproteobacteria bacterium]